MSSNFIGQFDSETQHVLNSLSTLEHELDNISPSTLPNIISSEPNSQNDINNLNDNDIMMESQKANEPELCHSTTEIDDGDLSCIFTFASYLEYIQTHPLEYLLSYHEWEDIVLLSNGADERMFDSLTLIHKMHYN